MEQVQLIFSGTEFSETENKELRCYANIHNEIFIDIKDTTDNYPINFQIICLNKTTAVRLVRELKKQIGYITESEVSNG